MSVISKLADCTVFMEGFSHQQQQQQLCENRAWEDSSVNKPLALKTWTHSIPRPHVKNNNKASKPTTQVVCACDSNTGGEGAFRQA